MSTAALMQRSSLPPRGGAPRARLWGVMAAVLLSLGCAPGMFSMKITVDPVANANYPVALSVLVLYDKAPLAKLQEMNARQWFTQREQFLRDNAKTVSEDYFEFVPGQVVPPLKRPLKDKTTLGLVFANYRTPGAHRYTFDPSHDNRVTLGQKGVSVSDLEPPKRKGLSLSDVPTEAPELPAGLPEVPNPLQ